MLLSQLLITLGFASAALGSSYRPDSKLAKNVLEETKEGYYCSPSGPIESTHCLYETVEILNSDLYPVLQKLVDFPFFRHYKVDLFRECPFWYENGFCMNRACGVEAANEDDIPEKWRTQSLSAVRKSGDISGGVSGCYFREQDFCYIEDDATPDGEYIDLGLNPERFTGYAGDSAHQVWRAIYEENCFGLSEAAISATKAPTSKSAASAMVGGVGMMGGSSQNAFGFAKLNEGWGTEMAKHAEVDMCEEKKVYYRIISGLHASISIHICQEYLDQQTGEWSPNLDCFVSRLGAHPERLSNVYFNAVLLLRAIARAAPYLEAYDIATAPPLPAKALQATLDPSFQRKRARDEEAKDTLGQVLRMAEGRGISRGFDEEAFFTGPDAVVLKEQFKTHFRNVSRIMDCVGCDKCRLWGKLQVSGIGTALKILFELDEKALDPKVNPDLLQRSEVVALFNTLHRVSESLAAVEDFRKLYRDTQKAAKLEAASSASSAAAAASTRAVTTGKRRPKKAATASGSRVTPIEDGLTDRQHGWRAAAVAVVYAAYETLWKGCRGCWGAVERVLGGVAGTAGGKGEL